MNPLQTHSHLFANGKFKARYGEGEEFEYDYLLDGVVNRMGLLLILKDPNKPKEFDVEPNECTLIARRIEDMTDEEWDNAPHNKHAFKRVFRVDGNRVLDVDDFLYLLGIGVYPFSQEDFGDTVIDTRTLTNA